MYVLCSPCVLDPTLRAEGITRQSDLELFEGARERCRQFGIRIVPLPCPETLYLGRNHKPGTFLERLNTPDFFKLMDRLEQQVRELIEKEGPPLCIIGVNSSPTCGVTSTYYGSTGEEPPKKEGRGVFLSRFGNIPAFDVGVFSRYQVYLAAPLFTEAEREYNARVAALLRSHFFEVFVPQEAGDDSGTRDHDRQESIYSANMKALESADIVVGIIDGADADSGTAWEMGYATARQKPVIALRTDFRKVGANEQVNLMLEQSARVVNSTDQLLEALGSPGLR
jgi:nucleoside 2-deoxyribosyltransferase/predicted secreted protein